MTTPTVWPLPGIPRPDPSDRPDPEPAKLWTLIVGVTAAVILAAGLGLVVFSLAVQNLHIPAADAARTAVTLIGVPTAAGAVFVALRSVRLKERQLHTDQQRVVDAYRTYALAFDAEHTRREYDQEREFRARYVSAAEQIGHDSAAVRLAGVNAMAQLATDWEEQRQSCVDVLCAYLRLPQLKIISSSLATPNANDPADGEVRRTAQRLITDGFRRKGNRLDDPPAWPDTDLDLDGAVLEHLNLRKAAVRKASFKETTFNGHTSISATIHDASFVRAVFLGNVSVAGKMHRSNFSGAEFSEEAIIGVFCAEKPRFFDATFKDRLALRAPALEYTSYEFRRTSFAVEPPLNVAASYEECTVDGAAFERLFIKASEST
jgi:hypothetical protein